MGLYKPRRIWTFYICLLNHFNPRGWQCWSKMLFQSSRLYKPRPAIQGCNWLWSNFNPRGCISLDNSLGKIKPLHHPFQSTRLYKPRPGSIGSFCISELFQSTRLYKPRPNSSPPLAADFNFNPRGCISLDFCWNFPVRIIAGFQSTRLYKPRHTHRYPCAWTILFQSTRLYKPRR